MKGVPVHTANLIYKISKHNPLLSILGVLPNQLRSILKEQTPKFDEAFDDIAFTLFYHSYQIWKLRKTLVSKYWKEIAQEDDETRKHLKHCQYLSIFPLRSACMFEKGRSHL